MSSAELLALGAVGDTAARFFDANGASVPHEIDRRVVGLTLAQIQRIPLRIIVAGGVNKTDALAGALRGGLAAVIVLDAKTAQSILDGSASKSPSPRADTSPRSVAHRIKNLPPDLTDFHFGSYGPPSHPGARSGELRVASSFSSFSSSLRLNPNLAGEAPRPEFLRVAALPSRRG